MYIHRKQYPLILAFAITIHKCQGLSLDTAIIDLSQEVFGDNMAYVALSHVRTLFGLHLITLDPGCIRANNPCSVNCLLSTPKTTRDNHNNLQTYS